MKTGLYKHYKGKLYQVLAIARHSETLEEYVVYQALYDNYGVWIRNKEMFNEKVMIEGKLQDRFEYLGETLSKAPQINN